MKHCSRLQHAHFDVSRTKKAMMMHFHIVLIMISKIKTRYKSELQ